MPWRLKRNETTLFDDLLGQFDIATTFYDI